VSFRPLEGMRVLDLTSVVVGPVCTMRLAMYGADVVKVESPEGDLMRGLGGLSPTGQHSGAYLHFNRYKRNICLDLKKEASRPVVDRLVESADIIVANMRPSALTRLGLDDATIRSRFPGKVYCLITGFGLDGPYAGQPTYDSVVQGVAGMAGLSLARDGVPAYVPMLICDHVAGEIAAGAILGAAMRLQASGEGASIEVPMFETMAAFVLQEHLAQQSFDPPVGPAGDMRLLNRHNRPVRTADGWISLTVNTDAQVRAFLQVTGRAALADDPRFVNVGARARHVEEWFELRSADLTDKSTVEWLEVLRAADIAVQPCHTLETLQRDPHLQSVRLIQPDTHPAEGRTAAIRPTIRFDGEYPPIGRAAQPRGMDTRGLLRELGYSDTQVDELLASRAAFEWNGVGKDPIRPDASG
jgi:crotonobetainyl-CoA:carnitine CoA-transferase CaiB-like acyl-CoA transferase